MNKNKSNKIVFFNNKNKLYNFLAGKLATQITLKNDTIIRIDKSKSKKSHRDEFNEYFLQKLNYTNKINVELYHNLSHLFNGLQIVDIIAWSFFQYFEHNNDRYFKLIKLNKSISII